MGDLNFNKTDAAKETGSSTSDVSRAWHDAREDAAGSGELPERNANKTSDSESGGFLNFIARVAGFGSKDKETEGEGGSF